MIRNAKMKRGTATILLSLTIVPVLSSCSGSPAPTQTETVTSTVTATPEETLPSGWATPTRSAGASSTASSTGSPTPSSTGTETATETSTATAAGTPSSTTTTSSSATGSPSTDKTITVDGNTLTCAETMGTECDENYAQAFNRWGDNLDDFAESRFLGPLGKEGEQPLSIESISRLGLLACIAASTEGDSAQFVEAAAQAEPTAQRSDLLPFWFEAQKIVCTDVPFKS